MGSRQDLSKKEKETIVKSLADGKTTLEMSTALQRDHRTIKADVGNSEKV